MVSIPQKEFEQFVADALDALPERYQRHLDNVVIVVEDEPSDEQRQKMNLHPNMTLYGLYEGVPLPARGNNYSLVLPDKITIYKTPAEIACDSKAEVREHVRHTVWHEIAHYYGLDHREIEKRE